MKQHDITKLVEVSRRYGSDARYVLLGGGNTSYKIDDVMYVKASGHAMSTIGNEGFVAMSLSKLRAIWDKTYPKQVDEREKVVLQDMMDSRCEGESARPSVEALLHSLIPFTYMVHLHPAMVNGLTCSQSGKESSERLFPEAMWIPLVNPGYILAKTVRDAQEAYVKRHGAAPAVIFLQNHGVFVGADTIEAIDQLYDHIMEKLNHSVVRKPNFSEVKVDNERVLMVQKAMRSYFGGKKEYPIIANRELNNRLVDEKTFASIASAYTPDHIVYSGFMPLWIDDAVFNEADPVQAIVDRINAYESTNGVPAKIVAVQGTAAFAMNEAAMELFTDTIKVAVFTESFGGPRFMDTDQINFIRNWEVESYRAKMNS